MPRGNEGFGGGRNVPGVMSGNRHGRSERSIDLSVFFKPASGSGGTGFLEMGSHTPADGGWRIFPRHIDSLRSLQTHEISLGTNNFSGQKVHAFQKFPDDLKQNPEKHPVFPASPTEHICRHTFPHDRSDPTRPH